MIPINYLCLVGHSCGLCLSRESKYVGHARIVAQEYGPQDCRILASSVVCSAHPGLKAAVRTVWPDATVSSSLTLLCAVRSIYLAFIFIAMV